jgi:hypothetical protein
MALSVVLSLSACAVPAETCVSDEASYGTFTLSGSVTFGHVPSVFAGSDGKLDFSEQQLKPSRRILVQAVDNCSRAVAESMTDDEGFYQLVVPGNQVQVKAVARLATSNFSQRPTGSGRVYSTACTGAAKWDFNIVDNTAGQALHSYASTASYTTSNASADLEIPLVYDSGAGAYRDRSAAPFALADTLVSSLEQVCQADPATAFPKLMVNWSTRNAPYSGQKSSGAIGTSHFTVEGGTPQLYILGKEDLDTDEYDAHVVAHEFGHYLEYSLYRSDTLGGSHSLSDRLDPRVAFGEGYGNAFSAIATGDEIYVDSMGTAQANGDGMNIGQSTRGLSYNGVHNERSVQYLLWRLYQNNVVNPEAPADQQVRSFSKIHQVLKLHQSVAPAFTSLLTFASYYNALFGASSESLRTLWETELDTPYHALCKAANCTGSGAFADEPDPFDEKGLIGPHYASARTYGWIGSTGRTWPAQFWNLYRKLNVGLNSATAHDVVDAGSSSYPFNKFGYVRWYTYQHTAATGSVVVNVENLNNGGKSCVSKDWLDMYAFGSTASGLVMIAADEKTTGCPSVSFRAENGKKYLLTVNGALYSGGNLSSYDLRIQVAP